MLKKTTLSFLADLKKNNDKPWFDAHKEQYLAAKEDFDNLVQEVIETYGKIDPAIAGLQVKDCVFRIYRDVRFSKNKTPYKVHFAAGFNQGGKKVHFPGYYFHAEPGGLSYGGGGIWRPDAEELKKVRQEIDYNYEEFRSILQSPDFKKRFGRLNTEDMLMRAPQGYDENNPAIDVLKLKSFIADTQFTDADLISKNLMKKITGTFTTLKPLVDFLSRALE